MNEIMSVERFEKIKNDIAEIITSINELLGEETNLDKLAEMLIDNQLDDIKEKEINDKFDNLGSIIEEIHRSNLSKIPADAYNGFYYFSDFDFSETGADLDFNIMNLDWVDKNYPVRLKGCKVANFDFENCAYDEDSFDENFMSQYPDKFIDTNLPKGVRERFYKRELNIDDVIRYDLSSETVNGRLNNDAALFFSKVKPELFSMIKPYMHNNDTLYENLVR